MLTPQFTIRNLQSEDLPFILNSYLKSYRKYIPYQSDTDYYRIHEARFKKFLKEGSMTFVVTLTEDPNTIVGWSTFKITTTSVVFFYTYVKQVFRGFGAARSCFDYVRHTLPNHRLETMTMVPQLVKVQRAHNILFNPYFLEE